MRFKAVLSDLGNVVAPFDNQLTFEALAEKCGLKRSQVEQIMMVTSAPLLMEYELGIATDMDFHRIITARLGVSKGEMDVNFFNRAYCQVFTLNRPVIDAWARCRRAGATLVAVSNICPLRHSELEMIGALDVFHHVVASYRERHRKPSQEIMVRALDRAGVRAEDAIFVDDIAEHLAPAEELGIRTHHFTDNARFLDFLREMEAPIP